MTDGFSVQLDDKTVIDRLNNISKKFSDLTPAMLAMGETLTESTKKRFETSTAPDGSRWAPNKPATLLAMLNKISGEYAAYTNLKTRKEGKVRVGDKKGYFDKSGRVTQKSAAILANKKPLIDSDLLHESFAYQVARDGKRLEIGTNRFQKNEDDGWVGGAALFHFGSRDGTMEARPILGLSQSDSSDVLEILNQFCQQALDE